MHMPPPDRHNAPFGFGEAWAALPFNIKLMLVHLWRAEQEAAGQYPPDGTSFEPIAHRRAS
jgi:hypothetical protein